MSEKKPREAPGSSPRHQRAWRPDAPDSAQRPSRTVRSPATRQTWQPRQPRQPRQPQQPGNPAAPGTRQHPEVPPHRLSLAAPGSTRQHPAVTRQQTRQTRHPAHPGNPANTRQHPGNPATRPGNTRQPGNQGSSHKAYKPVLGNEGGNRFSAPSGCILSPSGTCLRKQSTLHVLITHPCTFTVCLYLCASERAKGGCAANRPKSLRH